MLFDLPPAGDEVESETEEAVVKAGLSHADVRRQFRAGETKEFGQYQ